MLTSGFRFRVACAVLALAAWTVAAGADVVKLSDGRALEGKIVQESDTEVKIELSRGGAITVPRKDVVEIVRQKSHTELLEEKLRSLSPDRPAGYLDLGKWCLTEMKREDLGVRLVSTAMALDGQLYLDGQVLLGDYWMGKHDKGRAMPHYMRAVLAAPEDPDCARRFDSVKDGSQQGVKESERCLLAGLQAYRNGYWSDAADQLGKGRSCAVRDEVEGMLKVKLDAMMSACQAKQPCKLCKGAGRITCPDCKGKGYSDCKGCGGDGRVKRTAATGTTYVRCGTCGGKGRFYCKKCANSTGQRDSTGQYIYRGGTITCSACKGASTGSSSSATLYVSNIDTAIGYLQRRMEGTLTLVEQAGTKMLRVGGAGEVENAEELIANPYWLGDRWGPTPPGGAGPDAPGDESQASELSALRDSAEKLAADSDGLPAFLARLRQTFGTGRTSGPLTQRVFVSEFRTRPPAAGETAPGPTCEYDTREGLLRPVLAQSVDRFAEVRVELTEGAAGIRLRRDPEVARLAGSPDTLVRICYRVAEVREEIQPQADRDLTVLRLEVKVVLIDLCDATGKIVRSVK